MSDSNLHYAVKRLIDRFEKTGLLKRLELSDEDLADSIWLALQMGEVQTSQKPEDKLETDPDPTVEIVEGELPEPPTETEPTVSIITEDSPQQTPEQAPIKSLPLQVPAAPALLNALELGRSLRPLMRKVPSPTGNVLDEEATVTRIAERDLWMPVTQPEPERWLDLELVVEESRSAFIWKETVGELQQLFETHGAFRNVRVWSLFGSDAQPQLVRRHRSGKPRQCQHSHRELIHPNQRGAVILVSDCTSTVWQNASIHKWLKTWSEHGPTTVLQLFPEWLWDSTQLGTGRQLFGTAIAPGVANPRLILENLPAWIPVDGQNALVLPVIRPEPELLNNWCRVVSGSSNARIPTFLFDLEFVREQYQSQSTEVEDQREYSAKTQVSRFLATASVTAQRLAGMMAAAPVNLSVVNLIRKTLLPEATPVHVAEVYMGGLLTPTDSNGTEPVYDFLPGVRQALNEAMGRNETTAVLDAISSYIAKEIDRPIRSFRALLALLPDYEEGEREKILPFAEVAVEVLENMGGEYAEFAREIADDVEISNNRNRKTDGPDGQDDQPLPEPPIQTDTFEVAFIEVEETVTFEFDVATLKRQPRSSKGSKHEYEWVIQKEKQQISGVIEDLGNGIQLELVRIPAGRFLMGSPEDELERSERESPQHEVNVSTFFMGRYPITQIQWKTIITQVPKIKRDLNPDPSRFKGDNRPVEQVSWYDAVEFCARLSQYTGQVYRLPSEAEWEYACRAGTQTPFYFGEIITTELVNYHANHTYNRSPKGEYREQTTDVGSFPANAWGLYDMHGNVWEWCLDDHHESYEGAPTDESAWIDEDRTESTGVALRGGSWVDIPCDCRSAYRDYYLPRDFIFSFVGFRVVRVR
ncbi:formylglycine-generating sulfatase enzyme family protein [Lyngbya aestuarii BL J]|uniref:Formylglycine-generating sulfatase enzyme family protein n=1 Tax=Lyngbya aestuarii BL J TaxID=1348334 RepID=U7QLA9_9CYAN|nr:formylglycine-generating sulfatase enzyme family protein [Lyngbya aestuarii BL J]